MHLKLALLLLLGATAVMALPVADEDDEDDNGGLLQVMSEEDDDDDMAEIEATSCARRSHKVYFYIGTRTYTYRYRACFNDANQVQCYDSRETLPTYCPYFFRGEDCVEIEWKVYGSTKYFEICDRYGKPCQQRIWGLNRSNYRGECSYGYYYGGSPFERAKAMAKGSEDCLCVIKKGKKKCSGSKCKRE